MIARILSALAGLAFIALTLVFVSLIVATAVAAGLIAGAWLWWRGRGAHRQQSQVIEGEYRIIESK